MADQKSQKDQDPVRTQAFQYASRGESDESQSKSDAALGSHAARQHALLGEEQAREMWNTTQNLYTGGFINADYWFAYMRASGMAQHKPGFPGSRF
jgi:hypothetical protein